MSPQKLNKKQTNFLCCAKKFGLPKRLTKIIFFTAFPTLPMWKQYLDTFSNIKPGYNRLRWAIHDKFPKICSNEDQYNKWIQECRKGPRGYDQELSQVTTPWGRCHLAMIIFPERDCGYKLKLSAGNYRECLGHDYIEYSLSFARDLITEIEIQDNLPYDVVDYADRIYPKETVILMMASYDNMFRVRIYTENKTPLKVEVTYYLIQSNSWRKEYDLFRGPENGQCLIMYQGFTKFLSSSNEESADRYGFYVNPKIIYLTAKFQMDILELIHFRFPLITSELIFFFLKNDFKF